MTVTFRPKSPWVMQFHFARPTLKGSIRLKSKESRPLDAWQSQRLVDSIYLAIHMVEKTKAALQAYRDGRPERVRRLLRQFFSSDFVDKDRKSFRHLLRTLDEIERGLNSALTLKVFKPEGEFRHTLGYVKVRSLQRRNPYKAKDTDVLLTVNGRKKAFGNIHISDEYLEPSYRLNEIASTIIHEAAHRYAAAQDYEYLKFTRDVVYCTPMPPEMAVRNADNIAEFCRYYCIPTLERRHPLVRTSGRFIGPC